MPQPIPQAEQTQDYATPQVSPPAEIQANPKAFGIQVGEKLSQGGQEVENQLGNMAYHMYRINYYRAAQQRTVQDASLRTYMQNIWSGDPDNPNATKQISVLNPDGSESDDKITVPAALSERKGNAAHGITKEFQESVIPQIQQMVAETRKTQGDLAANEQQTALMNTFVAQRALVRKTETQQLDAGYANDITSHIHQVASGMGIYQDPKTINGGLDAIDKGFENLQFKFAGDPAAYDKQRDKAYQTALQNSLGATVRAGQPDLAKQNLDAISERISPELKTELGGYIDKVDKAVIEQANRDRVNQQTAGRMDFFNQLSTKHFNFQDADNLINHYKDTDPELATAIQTVRDNPPKFAHIKTTDRDFRDEFGKVMALDSKEATSNYLMKVLQNKNLGENRLGILVNAAMQRSANLPNLQRDADGHIMNPTQIQIDGGRDALLKHSGLDHENYVTAASAYETAVKQGKTVNDAYSMAMKAASVQKYPQLATQKETPNQVMSAADGLTKIAEGSTEAKSNFKIQNNTVVPTGKQEQLFKEGQSATNPKTGEKMIYKDGKWQKMA